MYIFLTSIYKCREAGRCIQHCYLCLQVMIGGTKARAHRQKDGSLILTPDNVTDFSYEIPAINPSFVRKKYKYTYGTKGDMKQTQGKVRLIKTRFFW